MAEQPASQAVHSVENILMPAEQMALDNARTLATAESVVSFSGLMRVLEVDPQSTWDAAVILRQRLESLPLTEVREVGVQLATLSGRLGLADEQLTGVSMSTAVTEVQPVAMEEPPGFSTLEPQTNQDNHTVDAVPVTPSHGTAPEPLKSLVEGPKEMPTVIVALPRSSAELRASMNRPDAAIKRAEKAIPGQAELEKVFRGILTIEEVAALQTFSPEQREKFLEVLTGVYKTSSARPQFASRQVERLSLFMEGLSKDEVAGRLNQEVTAIIQSLPNLQQIFSRQSAVIQQAVRNFPIDEIESDHDMAPSAVTKPVELPVATPIHAHPDVLKQRVDEEPIHILVANRIITAFQLDTSYREAATELLNPHCRGRMTESKEHIAHLIKDYIVEKYGDIPADTLHLLPEEQVALRRLTGLFFNQGNAVDRPPLQLVDMLTNFVGKSPLADKFSSALYSGLDKLLVSMEAPEQVAVDPYLPLREAVITAHKFDLAAWTEAAHSVTQALAHKLGLTDLQTQALWNRAHQDKEGAFKQFLPDTKQAFERLQQYIVRYNQKLSKEDAATNSALRLFVTTAFGGPRDLAQIDEELRQKYELIDPRAEQRVMFMFLKLLEYIRNDTSGGG